ncbi:MAG: glycosyltransferase family 1 protein [Patescibacteria group bacterium]
MKIGIDASRYNHEQATGVELYSWHIINGIIQEMLNNHSDEIILYSKEPIEYLNKQVDHKNIFKKIIKAKRLWTLFHLSKEMMKNPPDVLFVPSHTLPLYLPKKTVITIHDVAFRREKKIYSLFQYHHLNWSTKFAVKRASKIIVPSETTKNDLIELFRCPAAKITVIPHGFSAPKEVDDSLFGVSEIFKYFKITKELPYILFVGRLENKKNLARLVSAFKQFSNDHPNFKLILAGKRGVGFEDVLKTVDKLKLMDKVILPGYITEDEKFLLYKYCKIFAFPSLYEGFGLPVLEAFHHKKPVLCSKIPALMEVCGDAAKYVDPLSVDEISKGLELLVNDVSFSDNLISKGTERLKKFSWEDSSKKTIEVIKNA